MIPDWDREMKNEVRRVSFSPFRGREYPLFMELPGSGCHSLAEALSNRVITTSTTLRMAERERRLCGQIEAGVEGLGFTDFTLYRGDIEQVDLYPGEQVGLLNYDLMSQPNGFSVEFLNRLPYQDGAGIICTFHNPGTYTKSGFMEELHGVVTNARSAHLLYLRNVVRQTCEGWTFMDGRVAKEEHIKRHFTDWTTTLLALVAYSLRHYNYRVRKIITYGNARSTEFRMTSIILTRVSRMAGTPSPSHRSPPEGRDIRAVNRTAITGMRRFLDG